jgi:sec-independent protein translocase protein TatA
MFRNPYADVIVVLVIVLLFFGPKRLPTLGRSLGQGLREFKDSIGGHSSDDEAEQRPELTAPPAAQPVTALPQAEPVTAPPASERESAEVGSSEPRS